VWVGTICNFPFISIQVNPCIFPFAVIINVYSTQVRLIGFCTESSLFLVYEFIENGNLSQHLRGTGNVSPLSLAGVPIWCFLQINHHTCSYRLWASVLGCQGSDCTRFSKRSWVHSWTYCSSVHTSGYQISKYLDRQELPCKGLTSSWIFLNMFPESLMK
jgi:hypothetical protein